MRAEEWKQLTAHISDIEMLEGVLGVLGWDEQTQMPPKAASLRGAQQALLSRLSHERITDPRIATWLEQLDPSDPIQSACARNLGRSFRRERKIPSSLVDRLAHARSAGFQAWVDAKKHRDFKRFAPTLKELVALSIERANAIDDSRHPYEVLLEEFDPGTSVESLRAMFSELRTGLIPLLDAIATKPQFAPLSTVFPIDKQWLLSRDIASALGYDFDSGRLDKSEHPFSVGIGSTDVRITSHLVEDNLLLGLGGTVHETGHALYEQGLPTELVGTTVRQAASYGLHESQSRFWENYIGRSLPFSRWLAGRINHHFPEARVDGETIYQAQNRVERGLIRTAADEVTYNLHVIIRFEIELALFENRLRVDELPEAWNEKYQEYLGVTPPDEARGVLQDVHWSGAAFGYFPSYTLGNLYAASIGAAMQQSIPDLWDRVERGEFSEILGWLREKIHRVGHRYESPEIIERAVSKRDHVQELLSYLRGRHGVLYGVELGGPA